VKLAGKSKIFPSASGSHGQNPLGSEPSPSFCYTCNVYVWILCHKTEENLDKFMERSLNWTEFGILEDVHLSSKPRL
jgi:hypothetical protein